MWVAAIVAGAMLFLRRRGDAGIWGAGWHWPVPDLLLGDVRYPAVVSQELHPGHAGVDIMYRRRSPADRSGDYPAGAVGPDGGRSGTTMFFAPPGTPILAAREARVWSVQTLPTGIAVVLDHGAPWATFYGHLATCSLEPAQGGHRSDGGAPETVSAGQGIGTMGYNPNTNPARGAVDGERVRHLHFEAWYKGGNSAASQDPERVMAGWERATWRL